MRRPILILVAFGAVAIGGLTIARLHGGDGQTIVVVEDTPAPTRSPEPPIIVDVAGAGAPPRVYPLGPGARGGPAPAPAGGAAGGARPFPPHQRAPRPGRPRAPAGPPGPAAA